MRIDRRQFGVVLAGVASSASVWAQQAGPFRTMTAPGAERLMLEGHDAVAYFTQGAAIKGDPAFQLEHASVQWRFASAGNMVEFQREPLRYMPQFGGYCSNGINYAVPGGGGGGPDTWRIYRGRLYVFGGQSARDHFEMDTELNLQRAHEYWDAEVAGSNVPIQRLTRTVFSRVPHYQSDAALQAQWEAKRAAGTLAVMPGAPQVVPAQR